MESQINYLLTSSYIDLLTSSYIDYLTILTIVLCKLIFYLSMNM